ncbi:C39 family peptidase [Streptomyces xylophagus]|uniref:C39 family peptidase n=1 Tax=Streptomyces xylophagus TaxID=285514 RepID=UPI0005BB1244|nr:C39 family peptidase [Streptomyces xylophagus]
MSEHVNAPEAARRGRRGRLTGSVALVLALASAPVLMPAAAFADTTVSGVIGEDATGATSDVAAKDTQVDTAVAALDDGSDVSGTVSYTSVTITGQQQQTSYWCVPASSRATLTAFGVTKYQSELAPLLGTTSSGTKMSKVPAVLNSLESSNKYVLNSNTDSAKLLFARVQVNVKNWGAPLIAAIQGNDLPLWSAEGYYGYHAVVLYGYASNNAWIQYDDPIDVDALYGRHVTNRSYLYAGLKDEQDYLVW